MYHKNEYPSIAALCAAFLAGSDLYPNFFYSVGHMESTFPGGVVGVWLVVDN